MHTIEELRAIVRNAEEREQYCLERAGDGSRRAGWLARADDWRRRAEEFGRELVQREDAATARLERFAGVDARIADWPWED